MAKKQILAQPYKSIPNLTVIFFFTFENIIYFWTQFKSYPWDETFSFGNETKSR